jgi:hypothetical protein
MPRYFFNLVEDHTGNLMRDPEGVALPGVDEARQEALGLARDVARHGFHQSIRTWRVVVIGEGGSEVLAVPLSEVHVRASPAWLLRCQPVAAYLGRALALLITGGVVAFFTYIAVIREPAPEPVGGYEMASVSTPDGLVDVRFIPGASAADITRFLEGYHASIVDGPKLGGLYRVRIADAALQHDPTAKIAGRMAQEQIVELAAVVR